MSDEEIKKIARLFVEETSNGDALDQHIDFAEGYAIEVLRWLSKRFCIVSKEQALMGHKMAKRAYDAVFNPFSREVFKGQYLVFESLFGKEMFEEDRV